MLQKEVPTIMAFHTPLVELKAKVSDEDESHIIFNLSTGVDNLLDRLGKLDFELPKVRGKESSKTTLALSPRSMLLFLSSWQPTLLANSSLQGKSLAHYAIKCLDTEQLVLLLEAMIQTNIRFKREYYVLPRDADDLDVLMYAINHKSDDMVNQLSDSAHLTTRRYMHSYCLVYFLWRILCGCGDFSYLIPYFVLFL
jgi:hypothetical protein